MSFIAEYADSRVGGLRWGVEPICRVLCEYGMQIAPSTYYEWCKRSPTAQELRDEELKPEILRVFEENFSVYGADKVWCQLNREGIPVARCTVERLMRSLGIQGIVRGKKVRTTISDRTRERATDLVKRDFNPLSPNRLWVADFTYVSTWAGMVYVAFVIDAFSRRILGWKADTSMKTPLVLDTLEHAMWSRRRAGVDDLDGLVCHNDAGSQYLSIAFTTTLVEAGIDASVGSVGDAYDNALAESTIGLYKTELINPRKPWKTLEEVEIATLEWVDWYNHRRLHSTCGDIPPADLETSYYSRNTSHNPAG